MSPRDNAVPQLISVAAGVVAAFHAATVRQLLPALFGSFPSLLLFNLVPPLVFLPLAAARARLPLAPVCLACALLPAVHAASLPLCDLVLLTALVSVIASHNVACFALFLAARLATGFLGLSLLPAATAAWLRRTNAPAHLLVALLALYAAHAAHAAQRAARGAAAAPVSKRQARRGKREQQSRRPTFISTTAALALALPASLLLTRSATPSLETGLRALYPRPLPPLYRVLAQTRGPTGLVSVVEKRDSHRMLAADLSVLGGYHRRPGYAPDSIFSQFHVHEAVRLARRGEDDDEDSDENATTANGTGGRNGDTLCIGVGVGVVARAFRELGSVVDAVELDPAVAQFARAWFALPGGVTVADARVVLSSRATDARRYDYIVHDAFTGGAVSTTLVSTHELARVRDALRDDGVLVLNVVAFGRARVVAAVVYDRLARVFGHVRMFSEHGGVGGSEMDEDGLDNVVLFASRRPGGVRFRKPDEADFLGSGMRAERLQAFEHGEIERGTLGAPFAGAWAEEAALQRAMWEVGWHHARLMKIVHPPGLWPALLAAERRVSG